jgi:hypothetical protein
VIAASSEPDFTIVQGDLLPPWIVTLTDREGAPLDLRGATVTLRWFTQAFISSGPISIVPLEHTRLATVLDPFAGLVRVDWQAGDTDEAGTFDADFRVTYPGPTTLTGEGTWPRQLYIRRRPLG